jgi:hypothetical protein
MKRMALAIALAMFAGVALAAPAEAKRYRDRNEIPCPEMPTTNDVERAREGGASLQFAGFGVAANKSRASSKKDVMMREGGLEAWSAAVIIAHACHNYRKLYPHDPVRQTQEMQKLRENLLSPPAREVAEPPPAIAPFDEDSLSAEDKESKIKRLFQTKPDSLKKEVDHSGAVHELYKVARSDMATATTGSCAGNACWQQNYQVSDETYENGRTTDRCGYQGINDACDRTTNTTCTQAAPMTIPAPPPIFVGNMVIVGQPIMLSSSGSCTTTFGF